MLIWQAYFYWLIMLLMKSNATSYPEPTTATFNKRILLAVTGLSPQIVTETLYALCVAREPAFIPTEVHLLTTVEGAERARLDLLSGKAWFKKLCDDYQLPEIHFNKDCIHILQDALGNRLDDIRSVADNEQAANVITNKVRQFTLDDECALHVSIAGGRKTMGFYVGYALSLYGRTQDRLSHVLVSSPYEAHPEFYYPTPYSHVIHSRDNHPRPMDTAEAQVTLAEIPFVRLRHGLPQSLLAGETDFQTAVKAVQMQLAPAHINYHANQHSLVCGGTKISLPAAILAFYVWFMVRKLKDLPPIRWANADAQEYLHYYQLISGKNNGDYLRAKATLKDGFSKEYFEQRKSRLHSYLKKSLGDNVTPYLLKARGKRPNTSFELGLEKSSIEWKTLKKR